MERPPLHQRDFKGIWIPKEIWISPTLSLMEKVLFVEIVSLDNERGCFASNGYFAEFFGISDRQIRNVIGSLKTKGFVTVTVRNRNERVIRAAGKYRRVSEAELRDLAEQKRKVIHSMDMNAANRAGRVGRKLPGR
jgi:transcription initiation factor IIE alpha subunit